METISEFFSNYWLHLTLIGVPISIIVPLLFGWRYERRQRWLKENGLATQAKILKFWLNGITRNTSSNEHSEIRGIGLLLEIYPQGGQSYQVKTRDQLHLLDIGRIGAGMMVEVRVDPQKPQRLVVNWGGNGNQ